MSVSIEFEYERQYSFDVKETIEKVILQALDYHPAGRVVKQRRYFQHGTMTICLDNVTK